MAATCFCRKNHALGIYDIQGIEYATEDDWQQTIRGCRSVWYDFVPGLQKIIYMACRIWHLFRRFGRYSVQNIGAHGVEAGEFIESVQVYDRQLGTIQHHSGSRL